LVNKKDKNFDKISNAGDCAMKCDGETGIHCRSFNYCPGLQTCYISDKHNVDGADTPVNINSTDGLYCSHYKSK
jgi:hypothetical protein